MKNANDPAVSQTATQMAEVFLFGGVILGSIFPIILLIMLNNAACQGPSRPELLESY